MASGPLSGPEKSFRGGPHPGSCGYITLVTPLRKPISIVLCRAIGGEEIRSRGLHNSVPSRVGGAAPPASELPLGCISDRGQALDRGVSERRVPVNEGCEVHEFFRQQCGAELPDAGPWEVATSDGVGGRSVGPNIKSDLRRARPHPGLKSAPFRAFQSPGSYPTPPLPATARRMYFRITGYPSTTGAPSLPAGNNLIA